MADVYEHSRSLEPKTLDAKLNILIHDYAGHPFQVDLSRELARRRHVVTHGYFAGDPGPKGALARRENDPDRLSFVGFNIASTYKKGNFVSRRFKDVEYGQTVANYIQNNAFDIVVSGNTPTESQEKILAAATRSGARFIYWIQDFYSIAVSRLLAKKLPLVGNIVGAYYRYLERSQLAKSDGVIIITETFRELASSWGGSTEKVHLIENWAAIGDLRVMEKDNSWSCEHNLRSSFVFLYSGTLGLKHNPEFLIDLARIKLPGTKIVVVAQGPGCDRIAEAKQKEELDNIMLLPLQPFERLSEVLASADVLVSVVEAEAGQFSVPSKVQSYLCAERAILLAAPSANLAAVIVARENAGVVVEPSDMEGFLEAAKGLAADRDAVLRYGRNGRSFAMRQYDIRQVADRFEAVFRSRTKAV